MNRLSIFLVVIAGLLSFTKYGSAQNWVQTGAPASNWIAIASSEDGVRLAAIVGNGPIYTSADSGGTWHASGASVESWTCIASSGGLVIGLSHAVKDEAANIKMS
jgi:hypothetical protein